MRRLSTIECVVISGVLAASVYGIAGDSLTLSFDDISLEGSTIAYVDPSYFLGTSSSSSSKISSPTIPVQMNETPCGEGFAVGTAITLSDACMVCVCTNAGMACTSVENCDAHQAAGVSSSSAVTTGDPNAEPEEYVPFEGSFEFDTSGEFPVPSLPDATVVPTSEDAMDEMFTDVEIPTFPTELPQQYQQSSAALRFSDVSELTPEGSAAYALAARGIINGFPDGRFRPELPVNRAEAAKMILLARFGQNAIPSVQTGNMFLDVPNNEWYAPYVLFANSEGIISGYPDRTFKAGHLVNTVEFLKMITNAFNLPEYNIHSYQDVPANAWFARYAGTASVYNLFPDRPFLRLQPERFLTRGEVAIALNKILQKK